LVNKHFAGSDGDPQCSHSSAGEQLTFGRSSSITGSTEAPAGETRVDPEVSRLKRALASALKRCNDSERAHTAVDASLQRVHGQVAELGRERSTLQSELRRLNNRYVTLATSHARLQAACEHTSTSQEVVSSPPAKDTGANKPDDRSGKAMADSKLTVLTRRVANRHARQHIVPAVTDETKVPTGPPAKNQRKLATVAVTTSEEISENASHGVTSAKELQLCQQRLAQANHTIEQLKGQLTQQSADQSAVASSLEELVLENDSLRQALAAAREQQKEYGSGRSQPQPQPQPQPPLYKRVEPVRTVTVSRGTAWWDEKQRQGPKETAATPSRSPISKHVEQLSQCSDVQHGADELSQLEHDEAATDMDMEMRE
jgi:hypothetical protein